jgi:transposase
MIVPPAGVRVLIATRPVDFRRGADGLAAVVQTVLRQDPFSGTIFVFRCKRADRVKLLLWDGSGLVLIWKRLETSAFKWPPITDGGDAAVGGAVGGVAGRARLVAGACAARRPAEDGTIGCWRRLGMLQQLSQDPGIRR